MAADFEIRRQEPSDLALELGMDYPLFVVWDLQADRRVPFGNCRRHDQAVARILRERVKRRGMLAPFSCAVCGIPQGEHGRRYAGRDMHSWQRPDNELILRRMRARRELRRR